MTSLVATIKSLALFIIVASMGISFAYASEVTGTISSAASTATGSATGALSGSVTTSGGGGGSHSSSGGGSSGGGSSVTTPPGIVLGAATTQPNTPTFPNAGTLPLASDVVPWGAIVLLTAFIMILMAGTAVLRSVKTLPLVT